MKKNIVLSHPLFLTIALACFGMVGIAPFAFAYVRSLGINGKPVYWSQTTVPFQTNPANSSGLNSTEIETIFRSSFDQWITPHTSILYSYSQSTGVPPVSATDGRNTIYFASAGGRNIGFNIIAVTEVTYYVSTGEIAGIDMVFNDQNFSFTSSSGDTGQFANGKMKIFLGDVATHEVGHAWGIDHSTVHRSSMIYTAFTGQSRAGADDKSAIQSIYPAAGSIAQKGSIVGSVRGLGGGIFGAHISAIRLGTGEVEAATLANSDGSFRIGDISSGKYVVLMEPFLVSTSSISIYWDNIDHRFCDGGRNFRRSFYSQCGANGAATVVEVQAGQAQSIGTITPSCDAMANSGAEPIDSLNPKSIHSSGGAMFSEMPVGTNHYYKLNSVQGKVSAKAISYTLFSPLDIEVEILDENLQSVPGAVIVDNIENPMPGGLINYNASAEVNNLPLGNYILKVSSKANFLTSSLYPAGGQLLDGSGFYLLTAAVNDNFQTTGITDMSGCMTIQNKSQSPLIFATRDRSGPQSNDGSACATISSDFPSSGGGDSNLFLIFLTSILSLVYYRTRSLARLLARPHSNR